MDSVLTLPFIKAIHIIGFIAWLWGLHYIVRSLIMHRASLDLEEDKKITLSNQFRNEETFMYKTVCNPAMMLTLTAGIIMLVLYPAYMKYGWMHFKLLFIIFLVGYHLMAKSYIKELGEGRTDLTDFKLRFFKELLNVLMIGIVLLAVLRDNINAFYIGGIVIILAIVVYFITKQRVRTKPTMI